MHFQSAMSPHTRGAAHTGTLMKNVLYALVPGVLISTGLFGWGVLINLAIACVTAILAETAVMKLRRRPVAPALLDYSALVTACLLALSLPPIAPWWIPVIGVLSAILVAKHLYGGLGHNPFNPAMVGYVVLLISFPRELSLWPAPSGMLTHTLSVTETVRFLFTGILPEAVRLDGITMATALDYTKTQLRLGDDLAALASHASYGWLGARGWEWVSLGYLLGGLWLLYKRVISWHIPVAFLGSLLLIASLFSLIDNTYFAPPLFHLASGSVILAAFFIATDPVTASTSPVGRLLYAAGIGVLVYVIRTWGGYPDGIAFAVLIMNLAAPTIDHFYQPRAFGHK